MRHGYGWTSRAIARVLITLQGSVGLPLSPSRVFAEDTPASPPVVAEAASQSSPPAAAEAPPPAGKAKSKAKPPAVPPPPKVKVNRTVPKVAPVPRRPIFATQPKDEDFFRQRVFGEPLVPIGGDTSPEENQALAEALNRYFDVRDKEDAEALTAFLEAHPASPWRASLLLNLGTVYRGHGRFTLALDAWKQAWDLAKTELGPLGRAVADTAIGELADLHKQLGHMRELQEILEEVGERDLRGSAGIKMQYAREGEAVLRLQHDMGLPTGPIALDRILEATDPNYKGMPKELAGVHGKPEGFTLAETLDLATKVGLKMQMAFRESGEIPVASVAHLKVDRFTAVTRKEEGKYRVEDPALPLWMSLDGLGNETTGYFLIPEGGIPEGWREVGRVEGNRTHNNCIPGGRGINGPGCSSPGSGGSGGSSSSSSSSSSTSICLTGQCGGGASGGVCRPCRMAQYDFHLLEASLHIFDSPVGYTPPRGPAVEFRLDYNQAEGNQPGIFTFSNVGVKWTHDWLTYVVDNPTNLSAPINVFQRGGGSETYATFDPGTQSYEPHVQSRAVMVRTSTSPIQYERRLPDGSKAVFGQADGVSTYPRRTFMTQFIDPQGNGLSFTYDASLRLVSVTDAIGQVTTLTYENPSDPLKITKVTDPFGRFATLTYNTAGQLTSITDVIGITSSFDYETQDFIHSMTTPYGTTTFTTAGVMGGGNGTWVEATDPVGGRERVEYFTVSSLPAVDDPATIPQGMMTQPGTNSMLHEYITVHWDKRQIAYYPDQTKGTATRWELSLNPQFSGQVVPVKFSEKKPLENKVWYEYPGQTANYIIGTHAQPSAIGRVLDDGTSQIYRYEYNSRGQIARQTDPVGRTTIYNYAANEIDLLEIRQVNGQTTDLLQSFTYNAQHQHLTATDAAGETRNQTYLPDGRLQTVVTPSRAGFTQAQRTTTYSYLSDSAPSGAGRLQAVTGPSTPQGSPTVSYTHDGYGRVRTVTDPDGHALTYDYDALDRVTRVTHPDGTYQETVYNRLDPEKQRDRLGRWSHAFYDALRRPVAARDALGRTTTQQWCTCGSLDKLIDPRGNATTWERDLQGRMTREIRPDGAAWEYTYENMTSRLKQRKDPKNQSRGYEYFFDDNLKQITYTNAQVATPNVSYTYDPVYNRLAAMTDGTGVTTFSYYAVAVPPSLGAGRVASVDGPLANDMVSYTYDELGMSTSHGLAGFVSSVTYDPLGRITTQVSPVGNFSSAYDGTTSRPISLGYPNGQTTQYTYFPNSADHRLQEIKHLAPGGAILSKYNYTYDAQSNITTWTQEVGAASPRVYEFGYDPADQMTTATLKTVGGTPTILKRYGYAYDAAGNRTSEQVDDAVLSGTYNNRDELTSRQAGGALLFRGTVSEPATVSVQSKPAQVSPDNRFEGTAQVPSGTSTVAVMATDPSGNARTNTYEVGTSGTASTHSYDVNGNVTGDGTNSFEWDAENRLMAVKQGVTTLASFAYDGQGRRFQKVAGGVTRTYVYDGEDIIEERLSSGQTVRYVHGPGVDQPLAQRDDAGVVSYYLADHLGSIVQTTSSGGVSTLTREYDPWGSLLQGSAAAGYAFTGREWDPETNLHYYRSRYFDTRLGRFLSEDPSGFDRTANRYAYVTNRPVKATDPSGRHMVEGPNGEPVWHSWCVLGHFHDPMTGDWSICGFDPPQMPDLPSLKCLAICVPSVYLDDLLVIFTGKVAGMVPKLKVVAMWTTRLNVVLACMNIPSYITCVKLCPE